MEVIKITTLGGVLVPPPPQESMNRTYWALLKNATRDLQDMNLPIYNWVEFSALVKRNLDLEDMAEIIRNTGIDFSALSRLHVCGFEIVENADFVETRILSSTDAKELIKLIGTNDAFVGKNTYLSTDFEALGFNAVRDNPTSRNSSIKLTKLNGDLRWGIEN
jgi:hypothetical protein